MSALGLSPHARGAALLRAVPIPVPGTISARAGSRFFPGRCSPRPRGGHAELRGPSSCARGAGRGAPAAGRHQGISPARAGMVPSTASVSRPSPAAPRLRGDGPTRPLPGVATGICSPPARGWSQETPMGVQLADPRYRCGGWWPAGPRCRDERRGGVVRRERAARGRRRPRGFPGGPGGGGSTGAGAAAGRPPSPCWRRVRAARGGRCGAWRDALSRGRWSVTL